MKVRDAFKDPSYSEFTQVAVDVGETLEAKEWKLQSEGYGQGIQTFNFKKGKFLVDVLIEEKD